jgi:ubiquinone/menaquinone biosynthesis C-methylase UbiE
VTPDASRGSTTDEYTLLDQQLMQKAERYFAWQARVALEHVGQRVIEVGCGTGNFTRHMLDRQSILGLDVVKDCVIHLRERLGNPKNVETQILDIQDPAFLALRDFRADTVVCLNVLEHICDDKRALRHMLEVLQPGGRAIFLLPASEALYGPIDQKLGHFRRYSKRLWRELAQSTGFRVKICRNFNFPGFFGWWANAKIFKHEHQSAAQIEFFDSKVVPIISRVERRIEPPVGQSIFTVLEKPA